MNGGYELKTLDELGATEGDRVVYLGETRPHTFHGEVLTVNQYGRAMPGAWNRDQPYFIREGDTLKQKKPTGFARFIKETTQ